MSQPSFFAELKRRNVLRAGVLYVGAVWAFGQGLSQFSPALGLPEWATRWFLLAAAIGFPFWLIFAWFYELTPQGLKRESEILPEDSIVQHTSRRLDFTIIGVLAVAVVLLLTDRFVPRKSTVEVAEKSIAVLPFANTSGDSGNEYFSDGLSEELISTLSRLANLKVIGRTSSFQFKGKPDSSQAIGSALGVAYLLEGSVRKSADRVRIAVSLLKAADGANVWSDSYDRDLKDIFSVQSEIAGTVADKLKVALLGNNTLLGQAASATASSTLNVAAYTAFMQARFHANRQTEADVTKAIDYYNEAIRLDPGYALAYAGLALAWSDLSAIWTGGGEAFAGFAKARSAATKALALAPDLSLAHLALGDVLLQADLNISGPGEEYRRASALAPGDAAPIFAMSFLLAARGQYLEAQRAMDNAIALDPLHTEVYVFKARMLLAQGRWDEAEVTARKGIELQPTASRFHAILTALDILRHRTAEALENANREGDGFWKEYAVAMALQAQNDPAQADAALAALIQRYADSGATQIASLYAQRKDPDKMIQWLEHGYSSKDPGVVMIPLNDPFLLAYKTDPRFVAFCRKVGLIGADESVP